MCATITVSDGTLKWLNGWSSIPPLRRLHRIRVQNSTVFIQCVCDLTGQLCVRMLCLFSLASLTIRWTWERESRLNQLNIHNETKTHTMRSLVYKHRKTTSQYVWVWLYVWLMQVDQTRESEDVRTITSIGQLCSYTLYGSWYLFAYLYVYSIVNFLILNVLRLSCFRPKNLIIILLVGKLIVQRNNVTVVPCKQVGGGGEDNK